MTAGHATLAIASLYELWFRCDAQYSADLPTLNCINNNPALACPVLTGRCITVEVRPCATPQPAV